MSAHLAAPVMCVVTRVRGIAGSPERTRLLDRLHEAALAGVSLVQVRERQLGDRELIAFVTDVVAVLRKSAAAVLVNDRVDVALAAGASGVHLKSDGPSASDVRRIVPAGFLIGRSVHSVVEAETAQRQGACDYLVFGTVFPSSSKPEGHRVAGVELLADVCRAVSLPVLAIGGITADRARLVAGAGAAGVAAISLFSDASNLADVIAATRAAFDMGLEQRSN